MIFTGFRVDIPEILAATDVFVLPSLSEGFPKSLLEAMAAGKAVVVTAVGGVKELIEHDATGLLVPQRDSAALADAVCRLLGSRHQLEEMGKRAQAHVTLNFGVDSMASAYDALYQSRLSMR
jgi:glycosyltransferase involved in cell wall biosynthesis